MNKEQLYRFEASIEVGKTWEKRPINIEPLHACGRHKAAAEATRIIYKKFPEAKRVTVNAFAIS